MSIHLLYSDLWLTLSHFLDLPSLVHLANTSQTIQTQFLKLPIKSLYNATQSHQSRSFINTITSRYSDWIGSVSDQFDLNEIPETLRSLKICQLAVKSNGWNLRCVPEQLITPEMCQLSIKSNGWSLLFVPETLLNLEMCQLAIQWSGYVLQMIPEKFQTLEIRQLASNHSLYPYIPDS